VIVLWFVIFAVFFYLISIMVDRPSDPLSRPLRQL
jgi:hypothetical protein